MKKIVLFLGLFLIGCKPLNVEDDHLKFTIQSDMYHLYILNHIHETTRDQNTIKYIDSIKNHLKETAMYNYEMLKDNNKFGNLDSSLCYMKQYLELLKQK